MCVKDGHAAIEFYKKAVEATGGMCMTGPDGKGLMHAALQIGNSTVMLSEENPQWGTKSAETMGGSPASLHIYLPDVQKKVSGTFVLFLGPSVRGDGAFESQLFDFFR